MGGSLKKYVLNLLLVGTLVLAGCSDENLGSAPKDETVSDKEKTQITEEASLEKVDPEEDKKLLQNKTIYYETPKEETPKVHKEAENIVNDIAKKKNVNVKPNLNDARFRDFVFNVATDLSSLSKDQQTKVAEFAKYVDKYENKLKNKRIQELLAKVKAGKKLTGKERAELDSLLPIKGGTKIAYQKQPTKEQLKNLEPIKSDPNQQQPGRNDDENRNNPNDPGNNTGSNDNQGNQSGNGDNQGTNPGGNNDNQGNDSDQNNNNNGSNPGQDDGQNDGQNGGSNNGNDQNNNTGGNTGGDQNIVPPIVGGGSYDPIKARDYAYKWWNKRNNEQYGYYSRVMGGCYDCWYDCTNFVSQAIKEGGIKEQRTGGTYWYYSDEKPSYSWGVANSFYKHFKTRAKQVRHLFDLEVGDVVNADFDHDGDIEHSAIVTKVTPFEVYVTQHTTDRKDAPLSAWFNAGYDVYGWKMKTANGDHSILP